jgi:predicted MFS family arabinose efflux permease
MRRVTLQRDRAFWTIAMQVAIVNLFLGGFGPAQSLLRSQQHTSLTIASLHGTAIGVANILAGFAGPHLVHKFGRATTSWLGLALFTVGVLMFVLSPPIQLTLFATLIAALGVSIVINSMVTQLSHHYSQDPTRAVSQASGIASGGYVLGTLTVGTIAGTSFNWRLGLLITIPLSVVLYLVARTSIESEHIPDEKGPQKGSLNRKFWISWFGYIACISTEYATTFWAAALLHDRVGSSPAISTVCIVAVGTGMGLGRWFGPNLLNFLSLDSQLKAVMLTQFIGFAVLWFSHVLWISLFSLLAIGLGISMQFALASLRLIGFSEGRPDLAIGKSSLAGGIAIAGAPFILGVFGDHLGISRAYLIVPVLILIALAIVFAIPSKQSAS